VKDFCDLFFSQILFSSIDHDWLRLIWDTILGPSEAWSTQSDLCVYVSLTGCTRLWNRQDHNWFA